MMKAALALPQYANRLPAKEHAELRAAMGLDADVEQEPIASNVQQFSMRSIYRRNK
jgi:hypothetical protein